MKHNSFFKTAALLLFLASTLAARAEGETCLAVSEKDGTVTYFALSARPKITFSGTEMTVATEQEGSITVAIAGILKYSFEEGQASMIGRTVATEEGNTTFTRGKAYVTGLKAGARVCVYTIDGRQVLATAATPGGEACVDLTVLEPGKAYILRTPSTSYKIFNK